jgi:hypothetical protein
LHAHASSWRSNPFPRSGEFGALFVAAHFEELTGVAPQRVMMVHDSTVLLRALTADELARAEHAVWPLWNTPRGFVNLDSAETLITDVIVPAVDAECAAKWRAALGAVNATVTFGCMVVGSPCALRDTWDAGLIHAAPHITSRVERCRVERLLTFAMIVSGTCPRGVSRAAMIPALCGCIFAHPRRFDPTAPMTPWDAPERPPDQPFLVKHWLGR